MAAYEPGELRIPAIEVTYLAPGGELKSVQTAPIDVKVTALLAAYKGELPGATAQSATSIASQLVPGMEDL